MDERGCRFINSLETTGTNDQSRGGGLITQDLAVVGKIIKLDDSRPTEWGVDYTGVGCCW